MNRKHDALFINIGIHGKLKTLSVVKQIAKFYLYLCTLYHVLYIVRLYTDICETSVLNINKQSIV